MGFEKAHKLNNVTIMGNLLYIIAVILMITWAIGFFGFHAGGLIHFALVFAVVAVLFRISKVKRAY